MWGIQGLLRGFWAPDEARFVYVAGEMAAEGHFFVPYRSGVFYAHKPPLLFLLMNLFALPFGGQINGFVARLPSLIGAFLSLYATASIATRLGGAKAAWRAIAVLSTTFLFWQVNSMGQMDALLTGFIMSAIALLWPDVKVATASSRCQRQDAVATFIFFLAGFCMGCGTLLKGPVAFAIPILALLAAKIFSQTSWRFNPKIFITFLGLLIPPAIWLTGAYFENPPDGYFKELLYDQIFKRAGGNFGHVKSPFYFLWHFPIEFMPWTLALPFVGRAKASRQAENGRLTGTVSPYRMLLAWMLAIIIFFSIFTSKRNLYILAAYPAAAIMVALAWDDLKPRLLNRCALAFLTAFFYAGIIVYPVLDAFKTPFTIRDEVAPYLASDDAGKPRLALVGTNGEIYALYAGVKGITFGIQGNRALEDSRGEMGRFAEYVEANDRGAAIIGATYFNAHHGDEIVALMESKGGFYEIRNMRVGQKRGDKSDKLLLWGDPAF